MLSPWILKLVLLSRLAVVLFLLFQMVSDPEITKRLTYKMINRSLPAQLRLETQNDAINTTGLAAARCDTSTALAALEVWPTPALGQQLCILH